MLRPTLLLLLLCAFNCIQAQMPADLQGWAVVTCDADDANEPVFGLKNVKPVASATPGTDWYPDKFMMPNWTLGRVGQVFGIAVDSLHNFYVSAGRVYSKGRNVNEAGVWEGPAGKAGIYKVFAANGGVADWISTLHFSTPDNMVLGGSALPNHNSGLGNLAYNRRNDLLYVSNFEDGKIYTIRVSTGVIVDIFDPVIPGNYGGSTNPPAIVDPKDSLIAPLGDRVWGIQFNGQLNKLFFALWVEDESNQADNQYNAIFSVDLSIGGYPIGSPELEILMPNLASTNYSNPVADIAFDGDGDQMLIAERTMNPNGIPNQAGAHRSRGLKYDLVGNTWVLNQIIFLGSTNPLVQNAAGGCDFGYHEEECDSMLWFSADNMAMFDARRIYGWYGTHQPGNDAATYYSDGYFIDADSQYVAYEGKTTLADIEIIRDECTCPPIFVDLGPDTTICLSDTFVRHLDVPDGIFQWSDGSTADSLIVQDTGWYWVSVAHPCGVANDTFYVGLEAEVPWVNLGADTILCETEELYLNAAFEGAWYRWDDLSTDSVRLINRSGEYYVLVETACGWDEDSIEVQFQNQLFPPDLGPNQVLCRGEGASFNAAYPGAKYLWSDGSTGNSLNADTAGTYWVKWYNACDTLWDTVSLIWVEEAPNLDLGPDLVRCAGDSVRLEVQADSAEFNWYNGSTANSHWATQTGWYWVEATNPCGYDIDAVYIEFVDDLAPMSLPDDQVLCAGDSILLQPDTVQGNWLWSTGSTDTSIWVKTPGWYALQQFNACDTVVDSVQIIDAGQLTFPNLPEDTVLCDGQELLLDLSTPGLEFLWEDGSTAATRTLGSAGLYWVEMTSNCESRRDSFQLSVEGRIPFANLGNDTLICGTDSVVLWHLDTASNHRWSDGSMADSLVIRTAGWYWLEVWNDCDTLRDSLQLSVDDALPWLSPGYDSLICEGDSIRISFSQTGGQGYWWDRSTDTARWVSQAGTYLYEAYNACGIVNDSIRINTYEAPHQPTLSGPHQICQGDSVRLRVDWAETVLWNTGSTDTSIWAKDTGWYWVRVNNSCGSFEDSTRIDFIPPLANVQLPEDSLICSTDSVLLSRPNAPGTWRWENGDTSLQRWVNQSGWYWLEGSNGCTSDRDSFRLVVQPAIDSNLLGDIAYICQGDSLELISPYPYGNKWSNGDTNNRIVVFSPGVYVLSINHPCGNYRDSTEVIVEQPLPALQLPEDTILCEGETFTINVDSLYYPRLVWNSGDTSTQQLVNAPGWYGLEAWNSCGMQSDSVFITYDSLMELSSVQLDTIICYGDTIEWTVPRSCTHFSWWDGDTTNRTRYLDIEGNYGFVASNACDTIEVLLNVQVEYGPPVVDLGPDTLLCFEEGMWLTSLSQGDFEWWNGSSSDSVWVDSAGTYSLGVSNICGTSYDSIRVDISDDLNTLDLGADTAICEYTDITFDVAMHGVSWLWNDNSTDSFLLAEEAGIYWVEVSNHCATVRDSIQLWWSYCKCELYIANAFTPNGDGINEFFMPSYSCDLPEYYFVIYDRWGEMVFETYDQYEGWSGWVGNRPPKEDVYTFELYWTFPDGSEHKRSDRVSLIL